MSVFDVDDIEEVVMNQGDEERTTLDDEWTEEELRGDVYDECTKILTKVAPKHNTRAMYDSNLLKVPYLVEDICNEYDLIEEYNKQYDKHRHENKFGIHYFDDWLRSVINIKLAQNLVGGK